MGPGLGVITGSEIAFSFGIPVHFASYAEFPYLSGVDRLSKHFDYCKMGIPNIVGGGLIVLCICSCCPEEHEAASSPQD